MPIVILIKTFPDKITYFEICFKSNNIRIIIVGLFTTIEYYKGKRKSINFSEDDIENILNLQYGKARTYCALTLLYPSLNYSFKYHQDHIHPKSFFNKRKLVSLGIEGDEEQERFIDMFNKLPNLQLLQANQNTEKNNKHFSDWLDEVYTNDTDKKTFLIQNHIKSDTSLNFLDFEEFYISRTNVLRKSLSELLNVTIKTSLGT